MRTVHVAILAVASVMVASVVCAQGLGDVAAQEKQKRQDEPPKGKVYTESDLGPSMAPVAVPDALPASADETSAAEGAEDAPDGEESGGQAAAPSADEQRAQAEAAWRQKLEQTRKEAEIYQDIVDRLQLELNDISGGVHNPGRASKIAFLEENQQLLAGAQQRIADLEEEGRTNRYR